MILYIDESGSTGVQRMNEKGWNFDSQPYFVLAGILIDESKIMKSSQVFSEIKKKYKIQGELKYKNKGHRKLYKELIPLLLQLIKDNGGEIAIEVVNKKFDICKWITEYCFFPYYDTPEQDTEQGKIVNKSIANYVYEFVPNELLNEFLEIVDSGTQDVYVMRDYCRKLAKVIVHESLVKALYETIHSIENYKRLGLQPHNIFPIRDILNNGSSMIAVSANIDSYNNMIERCLKLDSTLKVIHDNQTQFSISLKKWSMYFDENRPGNIVEISFEDSKKESLIQIADYIAGFVRDRISNNEDIFLSCEKFDLLSTYINLVSTYRDILQVFPFNMMNLQEMDWFYDTYRDSLKAKQCKHKEYII